MVLSGNVRTMPTGNALPDASNDLAGRPALSIGRTCDVVKLWVLTWDLMWYTMGSGSQLLPFHFWCCSLLYELCWPYAGPGGDPQLLYSDQSTGASAFGMFNSSWNGVRISGLVGNTSS